jgi:transposase
MKKSNTKKQNSQSQQSPEGASAPPEHKGPLTIGLDLGDKTSRYCVLDGDGKTVEEGVVGTTPKAMQQKFGSRKRCRIALEVGTHSPWISRLLKKLGYEVIVANARQVRLIYASKRKDDRMDAEALARLARVDPKLLRPIQHRSEKAQMDLMRIRVRGGLVELRTQAVNMVRGLAKSIGERVVSCDPDQLGQESLEGLPENLVEVLRPLLKNIEALTVQIKEKDKEIDQMARKEYPKTTVLQQVKGVGNLIALTFVLTMDDPQRFSKSRDVGCYVGLQPKRSSSGESEPQLGITKEGDSYLRKLLVQGAQYILGHHGPDTDLRRWGMKLAERGGKNARKRAIVAVARKLAVLLHRLWVSGEVYEPLRNQRLASSRRAAVA